MPKDPDKKNGSRGLGGQKRPGSSHTIRAKDLEGVGVFTSQGGLQKSTSVRTIDEEVTAFDNLLNDMLVEYKKKAMSKIQFRNQQDNQQDDIDIVQLMDRLNSNRADFDNQTGQSIQILSAAVSEQQKDVHGMTKKQGPRKMAATKATGAVVGLVEQNKNTVDLFSAKKVSILEFAHIFNNLNKLKKDEKNVDVSFIASNFLSLIENGQDNFVIAAVKKMRDNEFSKLADAVISQARAVSLESDETYKNKLDKFVSDVEVPLVKQTGMVRFAAADRVVTAAEAAAKMSDEKKAKPSRP